MADNVNNNTVDSDENASLSQDLNQTAVKETVRSTGSVGSDNQQHWNPQQQWNPYNYGPYAQPWMAPYQQQPFTQFTPQRFPSQFPSQRMQMPYHPPLTSPFMYSGTSNSEYEEMMKEFQEWKRVSGKEKQPEPETEPETIPLYNATNSKCYVRNSAENPTYSLTFYNEGDRCPLNIVASDFGEFAAEPGNVEDYSFFDSEHSKYMETVKPLFEMVSEDPDPEEEELLVNAQDDASANEFYHSMEGFYQATAQPKKFTSKRLIPSPATRGHWFKTKGMTRPRSEWGKVKAGKTVNFFTEDAQSYMFRAPEPPLGVSLFGQELSSETFMKALQTEIGAVAHAVLSGMELTVRLNDELEDMHSRFMDNDRPVPSAEQIMSLLESASKFININLAKRYGNALRILSATFNRLTVKRRDLYAKNNERCKKATESGVVPPSERSLFGKLAMQAYTDGLNVVANVAVQQQGNNNNSNSSRYAQRGRSTYKSNFRGSRSNPSRFSSTFDSRSSSRYPSRPKGDSKKGKNPPNNKDNQSKRGRGSSSSSRK